MPFSLVNSFQILSYTFDGQQKVKIFANCGTVDLMAFFRYVIPHFYY